MKINKEIDLHRDIHLSLIIRALLADKEVAIEFYRGWTNMRWKKDFPPSEELVVEKLRGQDTLRIQSMSWREAGGVVSDIRNRYHGTGESYMDFYCAGFEGAVSARVRECMAQIGWIPCPWPEI